MKGFITHLFIFSCWVGVLTYSKLVTAGENDAAVYQEKLQQAESLRLNDVTKTKSLLDELSKDFSKFNQQEKKQYLLLRMHSATVLSDFKNVETNYERLKQATNDINALSRAKSLLSSAQMLKGDYQKSFIGLYELLDGLPRITDVEIKQSILLNALSTHVVLGVLDKAQDYSRQLLAMAKANNDQELFCETNYHIAHIQKLFKDYEYAYHLSEEGKNICQKTSTKEYLVALFDQQLAEIEIGMGKPEKALKRLDLREDYFINRSWPAALAGFQIIKAQALLAKKDFDEVLKPALAGFEYAKKANDMAIIRDSSKILTLLYKEKGDMEKAKFYNSEYMKASIMLTEQVDKRRLGYYQAMNQRAKKKEEQIKKVALEAKNSALIPVQ